MDATQHGCYFKAEFSVIVKGESDPRKDKMQAFHPNFSCILVKAAFLLGLLNPSVQGPYRRQSETGRPQHCSSQPLGLYEGGIREASACVAAIVYQETRGRLNNPPVNTAIQWETRKWQDPRDLRTHIHSLDLGGSTLYYLGDWRRRKGERGGELVHNGNWFLNGYKKKEEMYEKSLWAKRCEITQTESISFQLKWVKTIKLIFLCRLRHWNVQNTHFSWLFRVTEMTTFPRRLSQTCKPSLSSLPVNF